jgi:hypothetical protein
MYLNTVYLSVFLASFFLIVHDGHDKIAQDYLAIIFDVANVWSNRSVQYTEAAAPSLLIGAHHVREQDEAYQEQDDRKAWFHCACAEHLQESECSAID